MRWPVGRRSDPQVYIGKAIQGDELRDGGGTGVQAMLERENLRVHSYWEEASS